jgi:hypothetical protein
LEIAKRPRMIAMERLKDLDWQGRAF